MNLLGIVKLIANAVLKAAGGIKKAVTAGRSLKGRADKLKRRWKWYLVGVFMGLLLPVIALRIILGGALSLVESVKDFFTNQQVEFTAENLNDAQMLYDVMVRSDYDPFAEQMYLLDKETVLRILKKVAEYNREVTEAHTIEYSYRVESGKLTSMPSIDEYGNLGEVINAEEWIEVEVEPEADNGNNKEETETEDEKSDSSAKKGAVIPGKPIKVDTTGISGSFASGKPFVPNIIIEDVAVTEEDEDEEEEEPPKKTVVYRKNYDAYLEDDVVVLRRDAIDNGSSYLGSADNVFYMRWQPIVALSCIYIQNEHQQWGSYNDVWEKQQEILLGPEGAEDAEKLLEKERDEENYYLSDEIIDRIIDIYAFEYTYRSDVTRKDWWEFLKIDASKVAFDEFKEGKSAYKVDISTSVDETKGEFTRITRYIPFIAPAEISNTYIEYLYNYTLLESGDKVLTERGINVSYSALVEKMKKEVPGFTESVFLAQLLQLPGAEDLYVYYKDTVFPYAEEGMLVNTTTKDASVCPAIGVVVSKKDKTVGSYNEEFVFSGDSMYINLYPSDGWPGYEGVYLRPAPHIVEGDNEYGTYEVTAAALLSLTSPDNVTLEQIEQFLKNYEFDKDGKTRENCPLFANEKAIQDTAQCLYNFQSDTGASISGMFGIMIQEGGLRSASLGKNNWNFFFITAGKSWGYGTVEYNNHAFRDYKDKYETIGCEYDTLAVGAFEEQLYMIYRNYWEKGQNTYYKMVWNNTDVSNAETVYSGITHSYCPPWQDRAMPYSSDSHTGSSYYWEGVGKSHTGWINKCGSYRKSVFEFMQNTK